MKRSFMIILLLVTLMLTETFSLSIWKQRFPNQKQRNVEKVIEGLLDNLDLGVLTLWFKKLEIELRQMEEQQKRKIEEENRKKQEEEMKRAKMMQSFVKTHFGDSSVMKDFFTNRII